MKWIIFKCPDCKERWPARSYEIRKTRVINPEQFCPGCGQLGRPIEVHNMPSRRREKKIHAS